LKEGKRRKRNGKYIFSFFFFFFFFFFFWSQTMALYNKGPHTKKIQAERESGPFFKSIGKPHWKQLTRDGTLFSIENKFIYK
jgi:hypothetical protein